MLLKDNPDFSEYVRKFYQDLIDFAKHENQRKIDRDKAELSEEEF
jgi:hypothetical protein